MDLDARNQPRHESQDGDQAGPADKGPQAHDHTPFVCDDLCPYPQQVRGPVAVGPGFWAPVANRAARREWCESGEVAGSRAEECHRTGSERPAEGKNRRDSNTHSRSWAALVSAVARSAHPSTWSRRGERRAERRKLQRVDRLSAHLAELSAIRALLEQAAEVTRQGWVQDAWFTVDMANGKRQITALGMRLVENRPVTGACLVGSIVEAAGGPATVRSQLVQRTLDLAWHSMREEPGEPVRWCPGPRVRTMHLLDLTHWNDAPGRAQGEVVDLLLAACETAKTERDRCLAELGRSAVASR